MVQLRNVQKHVELHDIYQGLSREIVLRGKFFHRILYCNNFDIG